jgi:hypothetical protein
MKTLYESILDDEEVLMSNSIKDSQNPFMVLYNYYLSNGKKIPFSAPKHIVEILKKLELPPKSSLTTFGIFIISPQILSVMDDSNEILFNISFDGALLTWDNDDYKVYIQFEPMGNWGRKGTSYYQKLWKKKYNLIETSNPNGYIIK